MMKKKVKRHKAYYSISAVAKMFTIHQQTIRLYEKEGLISPKRSEGNTRLFSEEDVTRLEEVIHLTHQLGINLAGVQMIFKLQKQIKKMQKEMNSLFESAHLELNQQAKQASDRAQASAQSLARLRDGGRRSESVESLPKSDDWKIEYDE